MSTIKDVYAFLEQNDPDIASDISYASEMLLSALDKGVKAIKSRMNKAVDEDRDNDLKMLSEYRDTLRAYKEDINTYLDYNQNISVEPKQLELEIATTAEFKISRIDYDQYKVDSNKPHTLDEDFEHKKICAFMYNGRKYTVHNWKDTLVSLCGILARENKNKLVEFVNSPIFQNRKGSYFGYVPVQRKNLRIEGTDIYVWTNLSANAIAQLIKKILTAFDKNYADFYIYLIKDLTELHSPEIKPIIKDDDEIKIGKYIQRCMRYLEARQHIFSVIDMDILLDKEQSNKTFGITYPFMTDDKTKIYDKNGHSRYWKQPYYFNGKYYYITSQWFRDNREKFDQWYESLQDK